MKTSTKKLIKITAILSALTSVLFLAVAIIFITNAFGFQDYYINFLKGNLEFVDNASISFEIYLNTFDMILGCVLNAYTAFIMFKILKSSELPVMFSRILLYLGILQILFVGSLLVGVLTLVASSKVKEDMIFKMGQTPSHLTVDDTTLKIKQLKEKRVKGEITDEEYFKELNELIGRITIQKKHNSDEN